MYRRNLSYVTMGDVLLAVNEQNAVCGLLVGMGDKFINGKSQRATSGIQPFSRHIVNGQPKPISEYFTKVH